PWRRRSCAVRRVAAHRAAHPHPARQSAGATCRRSAASPARAPPPPGCSDPRRSPTRSAPARPKLAPSCVAACRSPGRRRPQPKVRSSLPADPSAFVQPPATPPNFYTNFWLRTLGRGGEVDQGDAELGAFSTPQMRGRLDEGHFECGSDKSFEEMPAPGRTIAQAEHDVNVQSGFATIVDSDVTDRTQHLALLGDRNFAIRFVGE